MSESVSFSVLTKDHAELNRLFDGHQRALFAKDLDVAIRSIEMFKTELDRHIDFEEQRLLPVYADIHERINSGRKSTWLIKQHFKSKR